MLLMIHAVSNRTKQTYMKSCINCYLKKWIGIHISIILVVVAVNYSP